MALDQAFSRLFVTSTIIFIGLGTTGCSTGTPTTNDSSGSGTVNAGPLTLSEHWQGVCQANVDRMLDAGVTGTVLLTADNYPEPELLAELIEEADGELACLYSFPKDGAPEPTYVAIIDIPSPWTLQGEAQTAIEASYGFEPLIENWSARLKPIAGIDDAYRAASTTDHDNYLTDFPGATHVGAVILTSQIGLAR